jgi:hypothetical protein
MKCDFRKLGGQCKSNAAVFIAVILLLCPGSASVLCIAPGGHIAIEDINALCCASSGISTSTVYQPDNGFNALANCQNCTDFFITPNGREAVFESHDHAAASPFADESLQNRLSADTSLWLLQSGAIKYIDAPVPISSAVPLRC